MQFVPAFPVTPTSLESSSIPELSNGEVAYDPAATYADGDTVAYNRRRYESQQGANTNHQPGTDIAWWLDIGPTNRWAMFDAVNGTTSVATDSINFVVQTQGRVDTVAVLNIQGASVTIKARYKGREVFNQTYQLVDYSSISNWYDYFFANVDRMADLVVSGLPLYSNMEIDVTINGSGQVYIGNAVIGQSRDLGAVVYGARVGTNDYSKKTQDDFGNYVVVPRAFSKRGTFTVIVKGESVQEAANKIATIQKILAAYRATPVLWVGAAGYEVTVIFGFYKSFELEVTYPQQSILSLELEGLT